MNLLLRLRVLWDAMSLADQRRAIRHLLIDALLLTAFVYFLYYGLSVDPMGLAFWPPFLGAILFYRYRQMLRRWQS